MEKCIIRPNIASTENPPDYFQDVDPNPEANRGPDYFQSLNTSAEFVTGYEKATAGEVPFSPDSKINVGFYPESPMSGIGKVEPGINSRWYKIIVDITPEWWQDRIFLQYQAEDIAEVWINGNLVFATRGGFTEKEVELAKQFLQVGDNEIIFHTLDNHQDPSINKGKQSQILKPNKCDYFPRSGLGFLFLTRKPSLGIEEFTHDPVLALDNSAGELNLQINLHGQVEGLRFAAIIHTGDNVVGFLDQPAADSISAKIPLNQIIPWDPRTKDMPHLYSCEYIVYDPKTKQIIDRVKSKFGLVNLKIYYDETDNLPYMFLNGDRINLAGVLNQGYVDRDELKGLSPDYTRLPEDVLEEIKCMKEVGFLFQRSHMYIPPKYEAYQHMLHGIIITGEIPNWGGDHSKIEYIHRLRGILYEMVHQLKNFTCLQMIIATNETEQNTHPDALTLIAEDLKKLSQKWITIVNTGFLHAHPFFAGKEEYAYLVHLYNHNPWTFFNELVYLIHQGKVEIPLELLLGLGEFGGVRTRHYPSTEEEAINIPNKVWTYGTGLKELPRNELFALLLMTNLWEQIALAGIPIAVWTQLRSTPPEFNGLMDIQNTEYLKRIIAMYHCLDYQERGQMLTELKYELVTEIKRRRLDEKIKKLNENYNQIYKNELPPEKPAVIDYSI